MYQNRRFENECGFDLFLPWKKISGHALNEKSEAYRLFWGMNKNLIQNFKEEEHIFKPPVLLHFRNAADRGSGVCELGTGVGRRKRGGGVRKLTGRLSALVTLSLPSLRKRNHRKLKGRAKSRKSLVGLGFGGDGIVNAFAKSVSSGMALGGALSISKNTACLQHHVGIDTDWS